MSNEQSEGMSICPHAEAVGMRWGDDISDERKVALQGYLDRWQAETEHGERKGPFDSVELTGADVFWLAEQSGRDKLGQIPRLHLEAATLRDAHLESADLSGAHLEGALLINACLEHVNLSGAQMGSAVLLWAQLEGADLSGADLQRACFDAAYLNGANLRGAHLEGAAFRQTHLESADLRGARMNKATALNDAALDHVLLDQLSLDGANLAVVKWDAVSMLGDEVRVRATKDELAMRPWVPNGLDEYEAAVRAHMQLAAVLRSQGMSEHADRFTYRAQQLQRTRYRVQRRYGQWLFSWLLFLIAGYGYRLERILISYALIVGLFAVGFLTSDVLSGRGALTLPHALDALQISLNAIHGRVFFAQFNLDTVQSWLATIESIVGIIIEGVFVAMLIQRFFGR